MRQKYCELQILAAEGGVDSEKFWRMTPRAISAAIVAHNNRKQQEMKEQIRIGDLLFWTAGKYNSFACNDPKKYPSQPYLRNNKDDRYTPGAAMSDEEMENWAKQFCERYSK